MTFVQNSHSSVSRTSQKHKAILKINQVWFVSSLLELIICEYETQSLKGICSTLIYTYMYIIHKYSVYTSQRKHRTFFFRNTVQLMLCRKIIIVCCGNYMEHIIKFVVKNQIFAAKPNVTYGENWVLEGYFISLCFILCLSHSLQPAPLRQNVSSFSLLMILAYRIISVHINFVCL
jgi:hypothetical protein